MEMRFPFGFGRFREGGGEARNKNNNPPPNFHTESFLLVSGFISNFGGPLLISIWSHR